MRRLLDLGIDLCALDWGDPGRADRWPTLDDSLSGYVDEAVERIRRAYGLARINLLGICRGGTLNPYAEQEDICLPAMTTLLERLVGSRRDNSARSFPAGHIGMYVSGKVRHTLPPALAQWLTARG